MERTQFAVGIGMPCGATVPWQTMMSLARTAHAAAVAGVPLNIHAVAGSSDVCIARDVVLTNFLDGREQYLFWIDSDISWEPQDFFKLLRLAKDLGVVCATYPLKRDSGDCVVNFVEDTEPHQTGCLEIIGTGLGFTCVRRDIIDAFVKTKEVMIHDGNGRDILDAFYRPRKVHADGKKHAGGEDGGFFDDLRALGYKIWLDPTICLGHVGSKEYRIEMVNPATDSAA
jgi:hypothetical protein